MVDVSRRAVVVGGSVLAGAAVLGGAGYWFGSNADRIFNGGKGGGTATGATGVEPERLVSSNGSLVVNLVAEQTVVDINGQRAQLMTYNGTLPGPTWVAHPGDTITVNFTNKLGEHTNLHTHGFHVSSMGNSDNIMVHLADGESFTYEYKLADDHPTGLFWYHPHNHGNVTNQLFAGLYGAILVTPKEAPKVDAERVLVLSDITLDSNGLPAKPNMMWQMMGREGDILLTNGQVQPTYNAGANAVERWHIVNSCASRYMNLSVRGGTATVIGKDSGQVANPYSPASFVIAPGNRIDLIVELGEGVVNLEYTTVPHPDMMGMSGTLYKNYPLASFVPSGPAAVTAVPAIATSAGVDLRKQTPAVRRTFTLKMPGMGSGGMGGMMNGGSMEGQFTINDQAFDMSVINTTVQMGTVEEWTIVNTSTMAHPFHLHVWPMQVLTVGPNAVDDVQYQDVVNVPAKNQTVVRIHFNEFPGTTVYHCHILDHEDLGMMGSLEAK
jgi:FtsP/CotA-like multicopper oxidase with cupredoxin domain